MSKKSIVDSFSYPVDDVGVVTTLEKIASREQRSKSHMVMEAIREYVKAHKNGNEQFTLEKSTEAGFEAFPTLGEKNRREKLEKMSDEDVATIVNYAYQWYIESEAYLHRIGYRASDIRNVKTGGWPALVAAIKESRRIKT